MNKDDFFYEKRLASCASCLFNWFLTNTKKYIFSRVKEDRNTNDTLGTLDEVGWGRNPSALHKTSYSYVAHLKTRQNYSLHRKSHAILVVL